ncbi:MAG: hypothetical protein J6X62_05210 [Bacteroidales bacterium]|nr:hypothetical protein [Bacteroidales bacterium]
MAAVKATANPASCSQVKSCRLNPSSQASLLLAAEGHGGDVGVVDGILQGVEYLLLA